MDMNENFGEVCLGAGLGLIAGICIVGMWAFICGPLSLVVTFPVSLVMFVVGLFSVDAVEFALHLLTFGLFKN